MNRNCEGCGVSDSEADMIYIPEECGYFVLCTRCMESIEDGWHELQSVIQEGVRGYD